MPATIAFDVDALRAEFPALAREHRRATGRVPRRPRRHPGPAAGDRRGRRLLPRHEREPRRGVRDERALGRRRGGGPRRRRRLRGRRLGRRDQVRPEHVEPHAPHRALHRGDARAAGRDRRHDPRSRGERLHLEGDGRRPRGHRPPGRHPARRRHPRPRGPRVEARAADAARGRGLRQQRGRHGQPGQGHHRARPRGRRDDLRRCGRVRAARADRRPGPRHRLPRDVGLQVVRAAPRARCTGRPRSSTGCRRSRSGPRSTGSRPGRSRSNRSPARWRRPTTCATSAGRTATSPARRAPARRASGDANWWPAWSRSRTTSASS